MSDILWPPLNLYEWPHSHLLIGCLQYTVPVLYFFCYCCIRPIYIIGLIHYMPESNLSFLTIFILLPWRNSSLYLNHRGGVWYLLLRYLLKVINISAYSNVYFNVYSSCSSITTMEYKAVTKISYKGNKYLSTIQQYFLFLSLKILLFYEPKFQDSMWFRQSSLLLLTA